MRLWVTKSVTRLEKISEQEIVSPETGNQRQKIVHCQISGNIRGKFKCQIIRGKTGKNFRGKIASFA